MILIMQGTFLVMRRSDADKEAEKDEEDDESDS